MTAAERRLTKRLDEMEKRVKELEAKPQEVHHHHYPAPQPVYVYPHPVYGPWWGTPYQGQITITTTPNDGTTWYAYSNSSVTTAENAAKFGSASYTITANGVQS